MTSKLHRKALHEAENQLEASLREAFEHLQPQLNPPFSLRIPSPTEYLQLNQAILYGILTQPQFRKFHMTHLSAIVIDGYEHFVNLLFKIVFDLYPKLLEPVKVQLIWVTWKMVDVSGVGVENLLVCLMRQIVGADFSDGNLWLATELLKIFLDKFDWLLGESLLLTNALFTYLRLLADHSRFPGNSTLEALKGMEIEFCIRVLRNHFNLCLRIGRDLIRLLQDLSHVPEFQSVCKDMLLNPIDFRATGFSDISQIYSQRTSSQYHLLRITPEMEIPLRFLLTHVKWGHHKRYQTWFFRKFLSRPENETIISDIVRFICCAHHPTNEIIQSDVIPRWAIIGWLLKCCRKNHVEANAKLALFYDWLFFHEGLDNIMNIEPGMLLMVNSIPKYIDITHSLLEFLFLHMDNYDVQRKDVIVQGVSTAFHVLVRNGVVHSLEVLTSCNLLSPSLKQRLSCLVLGPVSETLEEVIAVYPSQLESPSPSSTMYHKSSNSELKKPKCSRENGFDKVFNASFPVLDNLDAPCSMQVLPCNSPFGVINELVKSLGEATKKSKEMSLQILEKILFLFVNIGSYSHDAAAPVESFLQPEALAHQIADAFKFNGDSMFDPADFQPNFSFDDKIQSVTALIICTLIFSQHSWMQDMIIFWSRNGYLVGPWLLFYASKLAHEADMICFSINPTEEKSSVELNCSGMPFLKHHLYKYISFMRSQTNDSISGVCESMVESKLVLNLVEGAFVSYRKFLELSSTLSKELHTSLSKLLLSDLLSCCQWDMKGLKPLLCSIFCYLSDLSMGKEEFIRLLVEKSDHASLVALQFDICLKRFSLFGPDSEIIFHLMKSSLTWGFVEQQKLWGLMISELAVSNVRVEKLVMDFFYLDVLNFNLHSAAIEGLFFLCSRCAPAPELVGTILLLPDDKYGEFAASVLASWVISNGSMLYSSLLECLEKINKDVDLVLQNSTGVMINHSSVLRLLNFLNKKGIENTYCISKMSVDIQNLKAKLAHAAVCAGKRLIS